MMAVVKTWLLPLYGSLTLMVGTFSMPLQGARVDSIDRCLSETAKHLMRPWIDRKGRSQSAQKQLSRVRCASKLSLAAEGFCIGVGFYI